MQAGSIDSMEQCDKRTEFMGKRSLEEEGQNPKNFEQRVVKLLVVFLLIISDLLSLEVTHMEVL